MSNHHLSAVIKVCEQISDSGSTPSVGLIRAKLGQPVPLPDIIRGLKHWQSNPLKAVTLPDANLPPKDGSLVIDSTEMQRLYNRVSALEMTLINLQAEVQALRKQ